MDSGAGIALESDGQQPNSETYKEGYLAKQSTFIKRWNIRYVVLSKTELVIQKRPGAPPKPKRRFALDDIISASKTEIPGRRFAIKLVTKQRKFYLCAGCTDDRNRWMEAIDIAKASSGLRSKQGIVTIDTPYSPHHGEEKNLLTMNGSLRSPMQKSASMKSRHINLETMSGYEAEDFAKLCIEGISEELRGSVWLKLLGNSLGITEMMFQIYVERGKVISSLGKKGYFRSGSLTKGNKPGSANKKLSLSFTEDDEEGATTDSKAEKDSTLALLSVHSENGGKETPTESSSETPENDSSSFPSSLTNSLPITAGKSKSLSVSLLHQLVSSRERSIDLIEIDIDRTFQHHRYFQKGSRGEQKVREVLRAFACYRPDIGYVQGMSYLAGMLCLHMDTYSGFLAFAHLLRQPLMMDFYSLDIKKIKTYVNVFDKLVKRNVPTVGDYYNEMEIPYDVFFVDWIMSLFTRALPLQAVARTWDLMVFKGTSYALFIALAILYEYATTIVNLDISEITRFLHLLPEDINIEAVLVTAAQFEKTSPSLELLLSREENLTSSASTRGREFTPQQSDLALYDQEPHDKAQEDETAEDIQSLATMQDSMVMKSDGVVWSADSEVPEDSGRNSNPSIPRL